MYSVDIYSRVRRACLKDGMSVRAAARYFNKDRKTIAKMLRHELPSHCLTGHVYMPEKGVSSLRTATSSNP